MDKIQVHKELVTMMGNFDKWEREALSLSTTILKGYSARLHELGLTLEQPKIILSEPNDGGYESEMSLWFSDENGIFDALEFFVYRNGQRAVSKNDIETFLREDLDDVVRRRKEHLRHES